MLVWEGYARWSNLGLIYAGMRLALGYLIHMDLKIPPSPLEEAVLRRSLLQMFHFILRVQVLSHTSIQVYFTAAPVSCLEPKLVTKVDDSKQWKQNVSVDKRPSIEWA